MNVEAPHRPLIIGFFSELLHRPMARYFIASLLALALDTAVFSASLRLLQIGLVWSATLGFIAGAVLAYVSSITWVFKERMLERQPALEFVLFLGVGVLGLGITQAVLWLGVVWLHLWPEVVKLVAAVVTFICNYVLRRSLLFVKRAPLLAAILPEEKITNEKKPA